MFITTSQHFKDIPAIEKVIMVNPSSRAAAIEVNYTSPGDGKSIKINNEDELSCVAGETVTGLSTFTPCFIHIASRL